MAGLSLIWMVLSSWLLVLGRLKLLFLRWRREQQEERRGEEASEDEREPALFIMEISMQLVWKVCSSTNSWFCRGRTDGRTDKVSREDGGGAGGGMSSQVNVNKANGDLYS